MGSPHWEAVTERQRGGEREGDKAHGASTSHGSHVTPAQYSQFHRGRLSLGKGLSVLKATELITLRASKGDQHLHREALWAAEKLRCEPGSVLEGKQL